MQPFPLMNRATLNVKEAEDGGAISRGLEFRDVHVLNFIMSNLIYFLSLIVLMLSKCHYVWHGPQSLSDCSTVLSTCYYTS